MRNWIDAKTRLKIQFLAGQDLSSFLVVVVIQLTSCDYLLSLVVITIIQLIICYYLLS